ncbi:MAG: DUF285 domain-containing protein [Clostridia bacterium]|nr:DUF285 domain-containing protein [Clostridia bacterium]
MANMFDGCVNAQYFDLSNFNTSNVTTMKDMFNYCIVIDKLDIRNFNTSKVTNVCGMFNACNSLYSLALNEYFKTNNLTEEQKESIISNDKKLKQIAFNPANNSVIVETLYSLNST